MAVNMEVALGDIQLKNPIIPASGVYGFGDVYQDFYDPNQLGAIALKGTTEHARFGNPLPRIAECTAGMLNSIGLQNPGITQVIETEIPGLRSYFDGPIIANISGFSVEEYVSCCAAIDGKAEIVELNVSCPNVQCGGMHFGTDAAHIGEVVAAVRSVVKQSRLFVKLSPNVTDIAGIAAACEHHGADGISLINTLLGMRIDIKQRKPILANKVGGFSGPAIFPVALRMVYEAANAVQIPIMGMGGISSADDVIEMMMAGASAVQIGAENLRNPKICVEIIEQLPKRMKELNIENLSEIIGIIK